MSSLVRCFKFGAETRVSARFCALFLKCAVSVQRLGSPAALHHLKLMVFRQLREVVARSHHLKLLAQNGLSLSGEIFIPPRMLAVLAESWRR